MFNSKIALSLASIAAAGALVVGATFAFFTDTETSTGNTFATGDLDLKVDNTCNYFQDNLPVGCNWDGVEGQEATWTQSNLTPGVHKFFNFDDIKPGDFGEDTVSLHVIDNDAWGKFIIKDDVDEGQLGGALLFGIWLDQGGVPGFQCGEIAPCEGDSTEGDNFQQPTEPTLEEETFSDLVGTHNIYDWLADAQNFNGGDSPGILDDGHIVGSTTYYIGIGWQLPSDTGNEVQNDSLSATMEFQVVQSRNNPSKSGFPE